MEQRQTTEEWDSEFSIKDDGAAEWALERIAEEAKERDRLKAACDTRIDFYQQRKEAADKQYESRTAFLVNQLADYFAAVPHRKTKTQESYDLPSGKLILKQPSPTANRDETKLLAWAKKNRPKLVQTIEKPQWAEIKKTLTESGDHYVDPQTGEVVDGVTLEELPQKFEVKF